MSPRFDINEFQAKADEFVAQMNAAARKVVADGQRRRAADAEKRRGLADARRAGEHGRDWQVLQERIDMHRTTERDILAGVDHSAEARAVRKLLGENVARVRQSLIEISNDPEGEAAQQLVKALSSRGTEIH